MLLQSKKSNPRPILIYQKVCLGWVRFLMGLRLFPPNGVYFIILLYIHVHNTYFICAGNDVCNLLITF